MRSAAITIMANAIACLAATAAEAEAGGRPPNFVVIFADDLGYGDISCYDPNGVSTPHIDSLAAEGYRSTDFFVPANVCSPSRAALLTGRYPMRCGYPVARDEGLPKYAHYGLAPGELTIPELLKPAGYRSLMVGKWHLGMDVEGSHPLDAGFDEHLGLSSNYTNRKDIRGGNADTLYRGKAVEKRNAKCEELTQRYTDEVVEFIDMRKDHPFFVYVAHNIVHSPHRPSRDFVGSSKKGKYGDFIKELDHSTGRIMQALRDAGVEDNTLVVFTSDNGPTFHGSAGPLRGGEVLHDRGGAPRTGHLLVAGQDTCWASLQNNLVEHGPAAIVLPTRRSRCPERSKARRTRYPAMSNG